MFIPYIQSLIYGAQRAAKHARVTLTVDAGQGFINIAAQIAHVEITVSHKHDAPLITHSDAEGMAPTIDEAVDSDLVVFDVGTLSTGEKSSKLIQDDYSQRMIDADAVAKLLPNGGQAC